MNKIEFDMKVDRLVEKYTEYDGDDNFVELEQDIRQLVKDVLDGPTEELGL